MEERYNVYFAGELLPGQELASVRASMARLFKADEPTLDKLFSGKTQLLKRNCDRDTALKYRQAMQQAGAVAVVRAIPAAEPAPAEQAAGRPMTAAEKIAALAAAPDLGARARPGQPEPDEEKADSAPAAPGAIGLAPVGTAVLEPEERSAPVSSDITVPELDVGSGGERLSEPPPAAPPAPDTSHLSTAEVGELLPNLPRSTASLNPDTSALSLSPDGTDLSDCASPPAVPPDLDLSAINLAPPGADVLESRYRKPADTPPPATDHLALEE